MRPLLPPGSLGRILELIQFFPFPVMICLIFSSSEKTFLSVLTLYLHKHTDAGAKRKIEYYPNDHLNDKGDQEGKGVRKHQCNQ